MAGARCGLPRPDRSRLIDRTYAEGQWLRGSILVDGFVRGTWRLDVQREAAVMQVRVADAVAAAEREEVEAEAHRLIEFLAADADTREVRLSEALIPEFPLGGPSGR